MTIVLLVSLAVKILTSDLVNVAALDLVKLAISVHRHLVVENVHWLTRLCLGLKKACYFIEEKDLIFG